MSDLSSKFQKGGGRSAGFTDPSFQSPWPPVFRRLRSFLYLTETTVHICLQSGIREVCMRNFLWMLFSPSRECNMCNVIWCCCVIFGKHLSILLIIASIVCVGM